MTYVTACTVVRAVIKKRIFDIMLIPLILLSWRLVDDGNKNNQNQENKMTIAAMVADEARRRGVLYNLV